MSILVCKTCLFCFKTVEDLEENANQRKKESFQRFFRVLEGLFRQKLSSWMSRNSGFQNLLNLCENCGKIVESFCELYHQIRCLELQLNWKLETLRNVMKEADGVSGREATSSSRKEGDDCESVVKCEEGRVGDGGRLGSLEDGWSKLHSKLIATRGALMTQCTNYLSNSYPRIVIHSCGGTAGVTSRISPDRQQSSTTENYIPGRDDADLLQTYFLGWTISFVTVMLLFLLDSNNRNRNAKSSNLCSTIDPLIGEAEPDENNAVFDDDNDNTGEMEWEDVNDQNDHEIENKLIVNVTTSNAQGCLEELEQEHESTHEELSSNRSLPLDMDGLTVEENDKSLETVTMSELKVEKMQENLVVESSDDESLGTHEHVESAPVTLEDNPQSDSGSDTMMYTKRKKFRRRGLSPSRIETFKFQCPKCSRKYQSKSLLREHIRSHTKPSSKSYLKAIISSEGLTIKALIKKKCGKFQCAVNNCGQMFLIQEDLDNHSKLHGNFPCNFCDQVADFAPDLALHETQYHTEIPERDGKPDRLRLNCARCESKTLAKLKYLNHFLEKHLGICNDKIRCPTCDATFDASYFPSELARRIYFHYSTHHGKSRPQSYGKRKSRRIKQIQATHKAARVQNNNQRTGEHFGRELRKPFSCDKCLKTFRFKASLDSHMLFHTNVDQDQENNVTESPFPGTLHDSFSSIVLQRGGDVEIGPPPLIVDEALEDTVQDDGEQLSSRPRQLRNIHKCSLCKMTFSNLSKFQSHRESCQLDNAREMISDAEDDEEDEYKSDVNMPENEEVDDLDMEWKDGSESHASSSSNEADLEDTKLEYAIIRPEPNETEEPYVVTGMSSEADPLFNEGASGNNTKPPVKPVKLRTKEKPRQAPVERVKTFNVQCPNCPMKFSNKNALTTHLNTHITLEERLNFKITPEGLTIKEFTLRKHGKFRCSVKLCGRKFHTQDDLDIHSKLHGSFACSICSTVKKYAPDLAFHEANHRKETVEKVSRITKTKVCRPIFNCARCPHKTTLKIRCIDHLLEAHLGFPNDKIRCPICKTIFHEPTGSRKGHLVHTLYAHYATHHGGTPGSGAVDGSTEKVHNCDKCPAYFLTLIQLEKHNVQWHDAAGSLKAESCTCSDCGKKFDGRYKLIRHRTMVHKVEMRVTCPVENCSKRFETELDLEYHTKAFHTQGLPILLCPICGNGLKGEVFLQKHMRIHDYDHKKKQVEREKIVCDQCGKASKTTEQHKTHLLSHSGPESWEFACDTCGKKCLTKQKLNEHMRTHTKEKPFVCDTCGQAYAHRHNLRIHVNNKH